MRQIYEIIKHKFKYYVIKNEETGKIMVVEVRLSSYWFSDKIMMMDVLNFKEKINKLFSKTILRITLVLHILLTHFSFL